MRPYEKCAQYGASVLSDEELLAVILRTGSRGENVLALSERLCRLSKTRPGLLGLIACRREELLAVRGIGKAKACQILCLSELSRRLARAGMEERADFTSAAYIAAYYMEEMRHLDREVLRLLLLDGKNRLIADPVISTGTATMTPASPREIFREALLRGAVHVILLHNHPSGDPTPSREDHLITEQIGEAGRIVGIPLLDHIIIGDKTYESLLCRLNEKSRQREKAVRNHS